MYNSSSLEHRSAARIWSQKSWSSETHCASSNEAPPSLAQSTAPLVPICNSPLSDASGRGTPRANFASEAFSMNVGPSAANVNAETELCGGREQASSIPGALPSQWLLMGRCRGVLLVVRAGNVCLNTSVDPSNERRTSSRSFSGVTRTVSVMVPLLRSFL